MATKAKLPGPTAQRVAANVRALRQRRRLDLTDLAERLTRLGQPVNDTGLSRLENGIRRVDVDDLVGLALGLDVSPNALLLPPEATDEPCHLTPDATASSLNAWRWATGDAPFADLWADRPDVINVGRERRFAEENRPHDLPDSTSVAELSEHSAALHELTRAVGLARADGLSTKTIVTWVQLVDVLGSAQRGPDDAGGGD